MSSPRSARQSHVSLTARWFALFPPSDAALTYSSNLVRSFSSCAAASTRSPVSASSRTVQNAPIGWRPVSSWTPGSPQRLCMSAQTREKNTCAFVRCVLATNGISALMNDSVPPIRSVNTSRSGNALSYSLYIPFNSVGLVPVSYTHLRTCPASDHACRGSAHPVGTQGRASPIVAVPDRHECRPFHRLNVAAVRSSTERERLAGRKLDVVNPD